MNVRPLTVTNEEQLTVFERNVLRKIYDPSRDEASGQVKINQNSVISKRILTY